MTETKKHGRSIALSGFIGFVLVALLAGMIIGGALTLSVIVPQMQTIQQGSNQDTSGNQNSNNPNTSSSNNQNSYSTPTPTGNQNNNNYNNYPTSTPSNENNGNQNSEQNSNSSQGLNNTTPSITNPTGQYSKTNSQFTLTTPINGTTYSGTLTATVNCIVQQTGSNIQLDLTLTPTTIPQSLSQAVNPSPVTFNFAGTTSGTQFTAQASGNCGPDSQSPRFNLNLSGTVTSGSLTITLTLLQIPNFAL